MSAWRMVLVLAVSAAGAASGGAQSPDSRSGRDRVRVERLDRVRGHPSLQDGSSIRAKSRVAIRTPRELTVFMAAAGVDSTVLRGLPVDFSRSMVVVASMGEQMTTGNQIIIDEAMVIGDTIRVMVTTVLIQNCSPPAATSTPADIALIRKSKLPVVFVERTVYSRNCGVQPPPPEHVRSGEATSAHTHVSVQRLARTKDHLFLGNGSRIREKTRVAIRAPHELTAFMRKAGVDSTILRGLPVDFSRSMVVVASLGIDGTTGDRIVIDEAMVVGDTVRVMVTTALIQNCSPGAGVTTPADIALIRKSSLPVVFVERTVYGNCGVQLLPPAQGRSGDTTFPRAHGSIQRLDRVRDHLYLREGSGIRVKTRIAIRTPHELTVFMAAAGVDSTSIRGLPVDFGRSMAVVASMGEQMTTGDGIVIDEAMVAGDTVRVMVTTVLIRNCSPGAGVTTPADIALIRRSPLPVVFVERTVYSRNCGAQLP